MWRLAWPMMSNGSPYSLKVQVGLIATGTPPELQRSVPAWWTPRLWPSSWPITRVLR